MEIPLFFCYNNTIRGGFLKTFKQALETYLKSLNEENTIYVLKGFNYWLDALDADLFLGGKTVNSYKNLKESIQELSSTTRAMFFIV